MQEEIHVAVAVLRRADGEVLVAERPHWRHQGGGLEFPGGKVDPGETVDEALARELREELGIESACWQDLVRIRHHYADRSVVLHVASVSEWHGTPAGAEGQALRWARPDSLDPASFPAANRPIIAALRYPALCLVTPALPESAFELLVAGLRNAVSAGTRMIRLRAPGWGEKPWSRLVDATCGLVADIAPETLVLANMSDPRWLDRFPMLAGVHMSARDAHACGERPVARDRIFSCACHDVGELAHAEALGADIAVVGHVKPTPSHSSEPLGWSGLEALTSGTTLPVYAIGGLGPKDLGEARQSGAVGIAAIRGLWPG